MLTRGKKNKKKKLILWIVVNFVLKNQIQIGLCQQIMYPIPYIKIAHIYIIYKKLLIHIIFTYDHSPMVHLGLDLDY